MDPNDEEFHLLLCVCMEELRTFCDASPESLIPHLLSLNALLDTETNRKKLFKNRSLVIELCHLLHRTGLMQEFPQPLLLTADVLYLTITAAKEDLELRMEEKIKELTFGDINMELTPSLSVLESVQLLGEGGSTGDLPPGKSLLLSCLEVCLSLLVRQLLQLSPSNVDIKFSKKVSQYGDRLLIKVISCMSDLTTLASPLGAVSILPTILYLMTEIIKEAGQEDNVKSSVINVAVEHLSILGRDKRLQFSTTKKRWGVLMESIIAKFIYLSNNNDVVKMDPLVTIQVMSAVLPYVPQTEMLYNIICINHFSPCLKSSNPEVQNCCLQLMKALQSCGGGWERVLEPSFGGLKESQQEQTRYLKNGLDQIEAAEALKIFTPEKSGNINLQQYLNKAKKPKNKNIQQFNTLKNAITMPISKNTLVIIEQPECSNHAYELPRKNLVTDCTDMEAKENNNIKERIKEIISTEIVDNQSSLLRVKDSTEEKFHKSLSTIDDAFVERKYIKYCSKFWLTELSDTLKELTDNNSRNVIKSVLNSLNNIRAISDIPDIFKQLKYYKLLNEHYKLISKEYEKNLINRFKKMCLEQIVAYSESAKNELIFLDVFVQFLNASRNLLSIINELDLERFCRGDLLFDDFLKKIMDLKLSTYGENITALQEVANCMMLKCQQQGDLFIIDKFKDVISAYIKPVEIQEKNTDGRLVIEVIGKNITTGEIMKRLENKLTKNPNIEEVRIIGAGIVHINADFKREVWHGRNIVIFTKMIKIHDKVNWNVSGNDSIYVYSDNAGTGEDGLGKQGADGYAGESGGNVLILAEKIENPENFTIISNGGNGSKGQDGGKGKDGDDGISLTKREFDEKFPRFTGLGITLLETHDVIDTIVKNIKNDLSEVKSAWYTNAKNFSDKVVIEKITDDIRSIKSHNNTLLKFHYEILNENIFLNTITNQGNEITFSYERGGFITSCQGFLLYKGSLGKPGKNGGEYGLGGQGGYAGEVIIKNPEIGNGEFSVIKCTELGKEGEKGKGGLFGSHGINGWDLGVLNFNTWFNPTYYGENQNKKLKLEYYSDGASDRIWCPRYPNKYAGITSNQIEQTKNRKYDERNDTRKDNERQHHAQSVGKKNISESSILNNYSHHITLVNDNTAHNLRSDLENTKQRALQEINENQEQQEKQTIELGIKRHINFTYQSKFEHSNDFVCYTTFRETSRNIRGLIDILKREPKLMHNWLQLRSAEMSFSELDEIFHEYENLKKSFSEKYNQQNEQELKNIEVFLLDKYKLVTLHEIAKLLPPYQEETDIPKLTPESAGRYLIKEKKNNINISHFILGTLNQYIYQSDKVRENISKFFEDKSQNIENQFIKLSMRAFVLEEGNSTDVHQDIKLYHNKYLYFLEKQDRGLIIFTESFDKLDDDCCKNESVFAKYLKYIKEVDFSSKSYRELLANIFKINIRLYVEDQDNKLFLQDAHNTSSKQIINFLCSNNEFILLNIDEDYLKLEEGVKKKDVLYTKIFSNIAILKEKQELDDYMKSETFLCNNSIIDAKLYYQYFDEKYWSNEENDIRNIIEYFPEENRQLLKERLEKITFQYIGPQGILYHISKRLFHEGICVSFPELYYLISSIITSVLEDREVLNNFRWIVAAYPQRYWTDELLLLQLEYYFKKMLDDKSKWREYLSKIYNKDILLLFGVKLDQSGSRSPISVRCIEDTLYLLSNIPNETVSLEGLELSEWPYALKEKYWSYRLSQLIDWKKCENISTASYYLLSIENIVGTGLIEKLLKILEKNKQDLSPAMLTDILCNFHNETWNLNEGELECIDGCNISEWSQKFAADEGERDVTKLVKLIKGNANTSERIFYILPQIQESIESINNFVITQKYVGAFTIDDIKNWVKVFKEKHNIQKLIESIVNFVITQKSLGNFTIDDIKDRVKVFKKQKHDIVKMHTEMLAVIDRAIELCKGFKLRDTQKLTVLTLLTNKHNTLAQVSTGEGKSLIVVAASIMKALVGEKVHIVTSSSVLAKRDAEVNRNIYSWFDINVSHNCDEDIQKRKEAYSCNQVVYGDLPNFQRDYLLDKFYGKNILGDHNFVNVIIDEVDSMLLDKGNNMLYLSHDLAGFDKLQSVYIYIWQWINRPARDHKELFYAFDTESIKDAILNDLYGLIKVKDIGKLSSELSEQQKSIIWRRLVQAKILDSYGKMLKESIDEVQLNEVLSHEFNSYKNRLGYLLKERVKRGKRIHVPNYLKSFVEQHLDFWIDSAKVAFFMKAGQDYVVDVDRTGTSPDRNPNITILDKDTGTDQANSQWDEALHQFLQLKHGCKLSLQSLKAVFISNVSFFKLYRNLYGLTGTLGSHRERDLLQEIHDVDFVTIPTAKSKKFYEDKPVLCTSKEEWIKHIHDDVKKRTEEQKRSVLIICKTVNDVETFYKAFGGKVAQNVHTYKRDYDEFSIAQDDNKLGQGQIIIATNLAGRGTDIKITDELSAAGGLHVCLTYLPNNIRIEQQAFGRAGRCGEKGSSQLVVMDTIGKGYSNSKILHLKKERDDEELHRISDIKVYYETQIKVEEDCFQKFKKEYERLKYTLSESLRDNSIGESIAKTGAKIVLVDKSNLQDLKDKSELKEILLQSCLDRWAFWLDKNSKLINDIKDEKTKREFDNLLNDFISQFKKYQSNNVGDLSAWVEGNPIQMIKLGKYLSKNKKHQNAIILFDRIIAQEPRFSEAAHYYKAYALSKIIDWAEKPMNIDSKNNLKRFKKELRETAKCIEGHCILSMNAAGIIGKIKKNNDSIILIDAYEEQQKCLNNIYSIFSQSTNDIFGRLVTSKCFINHDIEEELAEVLYEDLFTEGILREPRVKKDISEDELKTISSSYGIFFKTFKDFLFKYKGKEMNKKEFQNKMKESVPLPSREAFWKLLIDKRILTEEIKYVMVNMEKLEKVNPSLLDSLTEKVANNELKKQKLDFNSDQIVLYIEQFKQLKDNDNMFLKEDFIKIVNLDTYKKLKKEGVLLINKKSRMDSSKSKSTTFYCYDSITLEDFTKEKIAKNDAEKILTILIEQKVLEEDSQNGTYRLIAPFNEIDQIQLSSCPVYEDAVKSLLNLCFTYKIVLQKMYKQLEEKNYPISLQLMSKPHQSLILELLERNIIKPVTVTAKAIDFEKKLSKIYSQTMTENHFVSMLCRRLTLPEEKCKDLFNHLVEKEWIIQEIDIGSIIEKDIINIGKSFAQIHSKSGKWENINICSNRLYSIKLPDKSLNSSYKYIEKTVRKILENQLKLAKKDTITNIINILEQSKKCLKTLKTPDTNLIPLNEILDQDQFVIEMHTFYLNGLDSIIRFNEKKWTMKMLTNTAILVAMGICQIAVGVAIELYSVGIMTHVGSAFINEGVNDIIFAAGVLKSGYFSWEDYRQHKIQSLIVTAATAGIGAYFSRGTNVSRFGSKLAGPNFKFGEKVAEMSGNKLIKTAGSKVIEGRVVTSFRLGVKVVGKEVGKRFVLKAIEGVSFGLANAGVDMLVENYLRALCKDIASTILTSIEERLVNHNISENLKKSYNILGEVKARKMIENLTKSSFTQHSWVENFLNIANKIASSLNQGIAEAAKKINKTGSINTIIHYLNKVIVWSERLNHIEKIYGNTDRFMDNLNNKIKDSLNDKSKIKSGLNNEQGTPEGYNTFKNDMYDQWKSLLCAQAGQLIEQHIVKPILKVTANYLVRYVGKKIQDVYQSYKESEYLEQFRQLKNKYQEEIMDANEQQNDASQIENHITKKYQKDLRKLMIKTKSPELFAAIIEENIPMDTVCVRACTYVILGMLKEQGMNNLGVKIIVDGECGISEEISIAPEGAEVVEVRLLLKDNHFQFSNSVQGVASRSNGNGNNCLFEALSEAIPALRNVTPESFRNKVSDCIKHCPNVQHYIQQGWHRLPMSVGTYGGHRETTEDIHDFESSSVDNELYITNDDFKYRIHQISKHLIHRFERFIRIVGMIQRASEETELSREEVFRGNKTEYQNHRSHRGPNFPAAHLIARTGKVNIEKKKFIHLYKELKNMAGHTQNVPVNVNRGVGYSIDKFQLKHLKTMANIDFSKSLTTEDAGKLDKVRMDFVAIIDYHIESGKYNTEEISQFTIARNEIFNNSIDVYYKKGVDGYTGVHADNYQSGLRIRKP